MGSFGGHPTAVRFSEKNRTTINTGRGAWFRMVGRSIEGRSSPSEIDRQWPSRDNEVDEKEPRNIHFPSIMKLCDAGFRKFLALGSIPTVHFSTSKVRLAVLR